MYCAPCKKKFKTDSQWRNHEQSKKHIETLKELGLYKKPQHNEEEPAPEKEESAQPTERSQSKGKVGKRSKRRNNTNEEDWYVEPENEQDS